MYERARRAADRLCRWVEVVCNAMLVVMTATIALLVLSRNLLGFSFPWSEELTRYLLVWLSMLGAAVLLYRNDHIQLDLLSNRLPSRLRLLLSLALRLLVLAFLVVLLQQSWLASNARAVSHSPALGISMRLPYLALPVGAALMIFVTLVNLWGEVLRLLGRRPLAEGA